MIYEYEYEYEYEYNIISLYPLYEKPFIYQKMIKRNSISAHKCALEAINYWWKFSQRALSY